MTEPLVLNPPSSTGFLLPAPDGVQGHMLIDMEGGCPTLAESLAARGYNPGQIATVLITHHHPDHFYVGEAAEMAVAGTRFYMGRESWAEIWARTEHEKGFARRLPGLQKLEQSGRLTLLEPHGHLRIDGRDVEWSTFPHGNARADHTNLAFRVDRRAFSGDTSIKHLLETANPQASTLLGLRDGKKINHLCLNVAQLSREDILKLTDFPEPRRQNYIRNHGILEELLGALREPGLRAFFEGLEGLNIHHVRKHPLPETCGLMRRWIQETCTEAGLEFSISFGDPDLDSR